MHGPADEKKRVAAAGPSGAFVLPEWPARETIGALTTTRRGGHSPGPYGGFNLALHVGDDPEAVLANRGALVSRLGLPRSPRWLHQVHGARVIDAADAGADPEADGAWTSVPGVACAVLTADCLPILLCDRAGTRVAALHCGWRGIAKGVIAAGIAALAHPPEELLAWLGPAIGVGFYEVDATGARCLHRFRRGPRRGLFPVTARALAPGPLPGGAFEPRYVGRAGRLWRRVLYLWRARSVLFPPP